MDDRARVLDDEFDVAGGCGGGRDGEAHGSGAVGVTQRHVHRGDDMTGLGGRRARQLDAAFERVGTGPGRARVAAATGQGREGADQRDHRRDPVSASHWSAFVLRVVSSRSNLFGRADARERPATFVGPNGSSPRCFPVPLPSDPPHDRCGRVRSRKRPSARREKPDPASRRVSVARVTVGDPPRAGVEEREQAAMPGRTASAPAPHRDRPWRPVAWVSIAAFVVHVAAAAGMRGPIINGDEAGYLGNARYIAQGIGRTHAGYAAGYSILITPAAFLSHDPLTAYHLSLVVNALLAATVPLLGVFLVRRILPSTPRPALVADRAAARVVPGVGGGREHDPVRERAGPGGARDRVRPLGGTGVAAAVVPRGRARELHVVRQPARPPRRGRVRGCMCRVDASVAVTFAGDPRPRARGRAHTRVPGPQRRDRGDEPCPGGLRRLRVAGLPAAVPSDPLAPRSRERDRPFRLRRHRDLRDRGRRERGARRGAGAAASGGAPAGPRDRPRRRVRRPGAPAHARARRVRLGPCGDDGDRLPDLRTVCRRGARSGRRGRRAWLFGRVATVPRYRVVVAVVALGSALAAAVGGFALVRPARPPGARLNLANVLALRIYLVHVHRSLPVVLLVPSRSR